MSFVADCMGSNYLQTRILDDDTLSENYRLVEHLPAMLSSPSEELQALVNYIFVIVESLNSNLKVIENYAHIYINPILPKMTETILSPHSSNSSSNILSKFLVDVFKQISSLSFETDDPEWNSLQLDLKALCEEFLLPLSENLLLQKNASGVIGIKLLRFIVEFDSDLCSYILQSKKVFQELMDCFESKSYFFIFMKY